VLVPVVLAVVLPVFAVLVLVVAAVLSSARHCLMMTVAMSGP
jgi:hypothetical protein